jgi:hypothetical protein
VGGIDRLGYPTLGRGHQAGIKRRARGAEEIPSVSGVVVELLLAMDVTLIQRRTLRLLFVTQVISGLWSMKTAS